MVATLAVLVVVFTVVGLDKNHQIDQLHDDGVAGDGHRHGCQGLLGGSGSNGAGYACRGTYGLGGHRYNEQLPGTALHAPGTVIRAVAVPGDPALVSPVSVVDAEHSSATVFILPAVLFVLLVAILMVVLLRRRRKPAPTSRSDSRRARAEPRPAGARRRESQVGACSACSSVAVTRSWAGCRRGWRGDPPPPARLSACCRR